MYKNAIENKKKIETTYMKLVAENDGNFTVTDLVKLAGINRGTFYLHFKNLDDVARSIDENLALKFKVLEQEFRQVDINMLPERIITKLNEILLSDKEYFKLFLSVYSKADLLGKIKGSVINTISNNFRLMRYVTNLERFQLVVEFIVGGVISAYKEWFNRDMEYSFDELKDVLITLIKFGLVGVLRS